MTIARPSAGNPHPEQAPVLEIRNWNDVVNPVLKGCCVRNHADACWFVLAVFRRRMPPERTVGSFGEPFVNTWQAAAGEDEFAHTFVEVNGLVPPPGVKLND